MSSTIGHCLVLQNLLTEFDPHTCTFLRDVLWYFILLDNHNVGASGYVIMSQLSVLLCSSLNNAPFSESYWLSSAEKGL